MEQGPCGSAGREGRGRRICAEKAARGRADARTRNGSGPNCFLTVSFEGARFDREAIFSGRSFERQANFAGARFSWPPDFDGVAFSARIDFTGAHIGFVPPGRLFHWTGVRTVLLSLRALRKIAEETRNHDLERDLHIEERKAERGIYLDEPPIYGAKEIIELQKKLKDINRLQTRALSKWWHKAGTFISYLPWIAVLPFSMIARLIARLPWIIVMGLYWALADYGRSFVRPAVALGVSIWLFHIGYAALLAQLMYEAGFANEEKYARAEGMVALGNAVPFVGPLTVEGEVKKFLFCAGYVCDKCLPIPPDWFQLLVIGQNVLSIILVFFIGLALRNYFKIK